MTTIEWTHPPGYKGESWNPVVGCTVLSPGCTNCYAMRQAHRIQKMTPGTAYDGTTKVVNGKPVWTGKVAMASERQLLAPLRWQKPRCIFVNSMGDLFHEDVPDEWIDKVFAIMALCPQHIFIVLTKRAKRMREYFVRPERPARWMLAAFPHHSEQWYAGHNRFGNITYNREADTWHMPWPLPNAWLGVSAEDQTRANERIPELLATPAAVRLVSCEPLLGPIDLRLLPIAYFKSNTIGAESVRANGPRAVDAEPSGCIDAMTGKLFAKVEPDEDWCFTGTSYGFLDWVIAGGESGPGARPMHPDWARALRDQCANAGVPFFFKQWGEFGPDTGVLDNGADPIFDARAECAWFKDGRWWFDKNGFEVDLDAAKGAGEWVYRLGKKRAGNTLDGRQHLEFPKALTSKDTTPRGALAGGAPAGERGRQ